MYNVQSMEFFLYFCAHRHRLARTERQISIDFESTQKWSSLPFIVSVIFLRMAASREAVNFRIAYRISSAESLIDTLLTQQIKGIRCQCQWIQKLYWEQTLPSYKIYRPRIEIDRFDSNDKKHVSAIKSFKNLIFLMIHYIFEYLNS